MYRRIQQKTKKVWGMTIFLMHLLFLHQGYDREGMPIKESYVEGYYDVTLKKS